MSHRFEVHLGLCVGEGQSSSSSSSRMLPKGVMRQRRACEWRGEGHQLRPHVVIRTLAGGGVDIDIERLRVRATRQGVVEGGE
jgi:hypothetical protein